MTSKPLHWKDAIRLLLDVDLDKDIFLTITAVSPDDENLIINTQTRMNKRCLPPPDTDANEFPDIWKNPIAFFVGDFLRFEEIHSNFPEDARKRLFTLHWAVSLARPTWVRKHLGTVRDGGLDDLRWSFLKRSLMTVLNFMEPESVGYLSVTKTIPFSVERDYFTGRCIARVSPPKSSGDKPVWMVDEDDPSSLLLSFERKGDTFQTPGICLWDMAQILTRNMSVENYHLVDMLMSRDHLREDHEAMTAFLRSHLK